MADSSKINGILQLKPVSLPDIKMGSQKIFETEIKT